MERRRQETRAKLLTATLEQMSEKGIAGTTLDDITDAADLSRRTFYYHFASKEECLVAAAASAYEKHSRKVKNMFSQGEDPAIVFAKASQFVMKRLLAEPITRVLSGKPKLLVQTLNHSIGPYVGADIQAGILSGRFKPIVEGRALTTTMMWSLVGLVVDSSEREIDIEYELEQYASLCLLILGLEREEIGKLLSQISKQ